MCGIVGLLVKKGEFPFDLFKRLLEECQIRGQHATGIAYEVNGKLKVVHEPVPARQFELPSDFRVTRVALGHTRYSTSDLEYNQPIAVGDRAIVLNGVITQADPNCWPAMFGGVECEGKNDAELLLRVNQHPLLIEPSSQAALLLDAERQSLSFWRNEERPLYFVDREDMLIVSSTQDIFRRCGVVGEVIRSTPCVEYKTSLWGRGDLHYLKKTQIRQPRTDLQP